MIMLTTEQTMKLAIKTPCSHGAARKWADPEKRKGMLRSTRKRVEKAARELGYTSALAAGALEPLEGETL